MILGNPGFDCSYCSVMCGRKDNLLRHVRNCHLDPCAKKDQMSKKISEDSHNIDGEEVRNCDNANVLSVGSANGPSSSTAEFSQTASKQNHDYCAKNGIVFLTSVTCLILVYHLTY